MPKKVCILYGLAEGRGVGKLFIKQLSEKGYELVNDATAADFIIAHSGGCFLLTGATRAKTILVNTPYWPEKNTFLSLVSKISQDFKLSLKSKNLINFARKSIWNSFYILDLRRNYKMAKGRKSGQLWQIENAVVIRNKNDQFCSPNLSLLPFNNKPIYLTLPGYHDDVWANPEEYLKLLK